MEEVTRTTTELPSVEDEAKFVEMDQEEIDAIIRNKRKIRDPKACYACHRRKVKCDRKLPCDSCVKRDHPELCSYERPTKKRKIQLSNALSQEVDVEERVVNSGPNITIPKEHLRQLEAELEQLRAQLIKREEESISKDDTSTLQSEGGDREGVHAPSNQTGTMHLGSRSVVAYMIGNRSKSTQDTAMSLLEQNILPNLGLDNETTTYPFVDLWSTNSSIGDVASLCKALPEDNLCREFWLTYRDIPCTIYPVVPDLAAFEQTMDFMIQSRRELEKKGGTINPERPHGVTLPWLALLFAVLASGCQSTGRPPQERELTSQVYICCSYQALRMSNFMIKPTLETVQAMLIVGNALSYNMNPGVAYILLGMTLRSALSMGLHVRSHTFSEHEAYLRLRVWWALAWQDSHFSVCYDRPSSSVLCLPEIPHTRNSGPGQRSYVESMSAVIKMTQEILLERAIHPKTVISVATITKYRDEVHRIWNDAFPRLRERKFCVVIQDHLERLALRIHCSYMISEICRPMLNMDNPHSDGKHEKHDKYKSHSPVVSPGTATDTMSTTVAAGKSQRKSSLASSPASATTPVTNTSTTCASTSASNATVCESLRRECLESLEAVVSSYVELLSINKFAARSWVGIQRSIASAFLLGVTPSTRREPRIISLLTSLEQGIRASALEENAFATDPNLNSANEHTADNSKETPSWVENMTKALNVLSSINQALAKGVALPDGLRRTGIPPTEIQISQFQFLTPHSTKRPAHRTSTDVIKGSTAKTGRKRTDSAPAQRSPSSSEVTSSTTNTNTHNHTNSFNVDYTETEDSSNIDSPGLNRPPYNFNAYQGPTGWDYGAATNVPIPRSVVNNPAISPMSMEGDMNLGSTAAPTVRPSSGSGLGPGIGSGPAIRGGTHTGIVGPLSLAAGERMNIPGMTGIHEGVLQYVPSGLWGINGT